MYNFPLGALLVWVCEVVIPGACCSGRLF